MTSRTNLQVRRVKLWPRNSLDGSALRLDIAIFQLNIRWRQILSQNTCDFSKRNEKSMVVSLVCIKSGRGPNLGKLSRDLRKPGTVLKKKQPPALPNRWTIGLSNPLKQHTTRNTFSRSPSNFSTPSDWIRGLILYPLEEPPRIQKKNTLCGPGAPALAFEICETQRLRHSNGIILQVFLRQTGAWKRKIGCGRKLDCEKEKGSKQHLGKRNMENICTCLFQSWISWNDTPSIWILGINIPKRIRNIKSRSTKEIPRNFIANSFILKNKTLNILFSREVTLSPSPSKPPNKAYIFCHHPHCSNRCFKIKS